MISRHADFDLSRRNTFRMRVRCALFVELTEEADLAALDWAALPQPVFVMGGGSNLLFTKDFPGTVLHYAAGAGGYPRAGGPALADDAAAAEPLCVTVPAGVLFDDFCAWAAAEGLWGPENLSLIPGEVGASAVQNIGAYGVEAKDIIAGIRAYDRTSGRFVEIDPADCAYAYRSSRFKAEWKDRFLITAVTYRLSRTPQPRLDYGGLREALAGSCGEDRLPGTCPPPDTGRGRGPTDTSSRSAGTQETLGGAGAERSEAEFPGSLSSPQRIREAVIAIRRRKLPDPAETGSAGSFFRNPVIRPEHFARIVAAEQAENGAGSAVPHYEAEDGIKVPAAWLIERCGLKGLQLGGAQVYHRQPLVIVNASGHARPDDILALEQQIIQAVRDRYAITLQPEVEHV